MANLIIRSSADNLVLQGSDESPAITVGTDGATTFAENLTLSGTANNLGTVTAGTIGSTVTFPSGYLVKQSHIGDEQVGTHVNLASTTYVDSGFEIAHTTRLASSASYLIFEFFSGMSHMADTAQNHQLDVTMRTVSNNTYTSGESITATDYGLYMNINASNHYTPIFLRNFCGLETEMGMPASKSTWAAGDTLYFRIFGKRGGSGHFRIAHINTTWNMSVSEVTR